MKREIIQFGLKTNINPKDNTDFDIEDIIPLFGDINIATSLLNDYRQRIPENQRSRREFLFILLQNGFENVDMKNDEKECDKLCENQIHDLFWDN